MTALTDGELGWPEAQPSTATAALGWPGDAPAPLAPQVAPTTPIADGVSRETAPPRTAESAPELAPAHVSRETTLQAAGDHGVSRETTEPAERAAVLSEQESARQEAAAGLSPLDMPLEQLVSRETASLVDLEEHEPPLAAEIAAAVGLGTARSGTEVWPRPTRQRMYTVANQKGGVGKTTSTVNLAVSLALHGARVLVVDLDPQGNASTAFGVEHREGTPSVYDVLVHGRAVEDVVVAAPDVPGLDCVPATIDLAGAEIELVSVVARESRLRKALEAVGEPYDYVFVDCPPSLGLLTVNALVAGREVLIPIQCEFYALEGLSQLLRNIELVRSHLNPALHVSTILLTMYDARTRLAEQVAAEVRNHFGDLVLAATIPRSVRISEAPGYGQSVMTYDPASRGAQAYAQAARELAERASRGTE